MKLQILYDKERINSRLQAGWGFSCLVSGAVLFDTGDSGDKLLHNMKELGTDISGIEAIVLSHDHDDHTGGLEAVLAKNQRCGIFICPDFSPEFRSRIKGIDQARIRELSRITEIVPGVYSTGRLSGTYKNSFIAEQSLVIKEKKKLTVITGCSHTGIVNILRVVKEGFPGCPVEAVFGGFHLRNETEERIRDIIGEFRKAGVGKAGPTHCSGSLTEELFNKEYGKDFMDLKTGQTLCF